jgi:hypothetical protein
MFILIKPEELEEEFRNSWKSGSIKHPSIDYQTNAIHGVFEGKDVIIFKFSKYGWINDNRFNKYSISCGSAGITISVDIMN